MGSEIIHAIPFYARGRPNEMCQQADGRREGNKMLRRHAPAPKKA